MKKMLSLALLFAALLSGTASPVGILLPDAPTDTVRKNASALQAVLKKRQLDATAGDFSQWDKIAAADTKLILGWSLEGLTPERVERLKQAADRGVMLVFQAKIGRHETTPPALAALFGARPTGYKADPGIGKQPIEQYMFWQPAGPIFGDEHPPFYAVYAGEAFALEAMDAAVAANWMRRDRMTADGPAMTVKGKNILLGIYLLDMAARNNRQEQNLAHALQILDKLLIAAGLSEPENAIVPNRRYYEPLNLKPISCTFQTPRAMWLWEFRYALLPAERAILLDFMAGRHISTLYMSAPKSAFTPANIKPLKAFIRAAGERGIRVEALDGWKEAALPEHHEEFLASLQRVLDYNRAAAPEERFAGFQSDIEPVTLKRYHESPESRRQIDRAFIELHAKCRQLIDRSGQNNFVFGLAASEYLGKDLNRADRFIEWRGKTAAKLEHLSDIFDYLAVMSYYDQAERTIDVSQNHVKVMAQKGKKVFIGCETLDVVPLFGGSRAITFYEEGLQYMERQLQKVDVWYRDNPGYGGIAIHHYESYRRMTDGPRPMPNLKPPALQTAQVFRADTPEQVVYGKKEWRGPNDFSAQWRFDWTPDALKISVELTDDVLMTGRNAREDLWQDDHLELWWERVAPPGEVVQLGIPLNSADRNYVWHPGNRPASERQALADLVSSTLTRTEHGVQVQIMIPAAAFGVKSFSRGMKLRLLAEAGDSDPAGNAKTMLSLAPHREREKSSTFNELELR